MEELLDILNEKGEKTGETRTIHEAHLYGLWHRSIHVWFLNSKGQLLLQKRSKNMEACPLHWDISAAGHISSGRSSLETAKIETEEELGLSLPETDFQYLFTVKEKFILNGGAYINNEFDDLYLVRSDLTPSEFKLSADEVEEVRWISIEELKKWIKDDQELLVPHYEEYEKLIEYLSKNY